MRSNNNNTSSRKSVALLCLAGKHIGTRHATCLHNHKAGATGVASGKKLDREVFTKAGVAWCGQRRKCESVTSDRQRAYSYAETSK